MHVHVYACMHVCMRFTPYPPALCAHIKVHARCVHSTCSTNGCEQVEKMEKVLNLTLTLTRWRKCYSRGTPLPPPPPPPP